MLMERILSCENLLSQLKRVERNKGDHGLDEMPERNIRYHGLKHWEYIKMELYQRTYEPQPLRRIEIPKLDGGVRLLDIPTVINRFILQEIAQVLTTLYDPAFSEQNLWVSTNSKRL